MATLTFKHNSSEHRYEAFSEGALAGFINYAEADGGVNFNHTEVLPAFEGKGVGSYLAKASLDDARAQGKSVIPSCSFIADYLSKHPEMPGVTTAQTQDKFKLRG